MKKNKKIVVLILLFILIWILVGIRTVKVIKSPKSVVIEKIKVQDYKFKNITTDSFEIVCNYPDPFLHKRIARKTTVNKPVRKVLKINNNQLKTIKWPIINYLGFVKSTDNSSKTGMFLINDKPQVIKEGLYLKEIKVLKIWRDSCKVEYKDSEQIIKRLGNENMY